MAVTPDQAARRMRVLAGLVALTFLLVACGQKPGVHQGRTIAFEEGEEFVELEDGEGFDDFTEVEGFDGEGFEGDGEGFDGEGDDLGDGEGPDAEGDAGGAGGAGGGTGDGQTTQDGEQQDGGGRQQDGGAGTSGSGTQQQQGEAAVRGSNRTGLTDDTLRIGAHAPVTGAAPLPARSFERASDLYWRWVTEAKGEKVVGRSKVEVTFADDRYQPSTAIQVCRQLASNNFLLFGAGGTDQIQQCGRFANQARVPYFSAGVTRAGLEGAAWYFAFSMPYRDQGRLLAQYVKRHFGGKRVAAIVTNTPNFDDAVQGWERGVSEQGLDYYRTLRHPRGDESWYNTFARELAQNDVEVVYILTAPVSYLRFAQQARQQGYTPQFVGVGITMGLNPLLESGCDNNTLHGGIFFSPFPGLDWARQNAPDFFQAAQRFGTPNDDLAFALWGQAKVMHELFKRYEGNYGTDLTREEFRHFVERQRDVAAGIFPPLSYAPDNHFGGRHVHVLQADCNTQEHKTLQTFQSGF